MTSHDAATAPAGARLIYSRPMLSSLRRPDGRPSLRARILAALVAFGALVIAGDVVLVPILRAVLSALR
ncbi:MAG: hypothetical protein DLM59_01695 [Pseudonocardiales bacterium]|nr:MAG: hypothetical protein DLM59_01695 [Pseudonocardiales bacterium]